MKSCDESLHTLFFQLCRTVTGAASIFTLLGAAIYSQHQFPNWLDFMLKVALIVSGIAVIFFFFMAHEAGKIMAKSHELWCLTMSSVPEERMLVALWLQRQKVTAQKLTEQFGAEDKLNAEYRKTEPVVDNDVRKKKREMEAETAQMKAEYEGLRQTVETAVLRYYPDAIAQIPVRYRDVANMDVQALLDYSVGAAMQQCFPRRKAAPDPLL